jgi:hypothetical protein
MTHKGSMQVVLNEDIVKVLRELALSSGSGSITEEIRFAIADRKFFSEKVAEGYKIFLEHPDHPGERTLVNYR